MSLILERALIAYARRFPFQRSKVRVIDALWSIAAGGTGTHRVANLIHGNFAMPCDIGEMLQRQFYFFGTYFLEREILECWQTMVADARVVFDIGANAGIYSLAALAVTRDVVVHAFEPTPEIAARLQTTAEMNELSSLFVHRMAVSDQSRYVMLVRDRGELGSNDGMNSIASDRVPAAGDEMVMAVRLDQFCRERAIEKIDLMKLDIQGHEWEALAGAGDLIRSGAVRTLFLELNWDVSNVDGPAKRAINLLESAGYVFSKPERVLNWRHSGDWLCGLSDIVARRRELDRCR